MESEEINLNSVCRTCKNESSEMRSLYHRDSERGEENPRLDEMLMACTTVQVRNEDDLPKIICRTCLVQLKNAYCFKEQCEKTDVFLRNYLKNLNRADIKQEVASDEGECTSNVIVDNETTPNDTNNDKTNTENVDYSESQLEKSGCTDVDYVQVFGDLTIYKCRTCYEKFYTIQGLRNHKNVEHYQQVDTDDKLGEFSIQPEEKEKELEGKDLNMSGDIMGPDSLTLHMRLHEDKEPVLPTLESLDNIDQHYDAKMESSLQSNDDGEEENVEGEDSDMGGDTMEPKVEAFENSDQDKIDETVQITNEVSKVKNPPKTHVKEAIIEDKIYRENEQIGEETNIGANNGNECKSDGSADSENLTKRMTSGKLKRSRERPRKQPIGNKPSSGRPHEHPPKTHECETCNKKFRWMTSLKRHKLSHVDVKPNLCVICKKCFARRDHLIKHMKVHNSEDTYNCDACEMVFKKKESLVRHKACEHDIGEKVIDKKFKFQCTTCEKTYVSKSHFTKHVKFHIDSTKKFLCTECDQRFIRKDYLVSHMKRHRGEKPFKCKFCGKGFLRTTDLAVHERYHTGEKTHLCAICGKGFGRPYNLRVHMRIHTGEKPYRCTYCDAAFTQGNDLKAHVRRHTGERYQCELCPKTFLKGYLLTQHKRVVHGLNIVSNIRRLQSANEVNSDDPPPITVPLPTPVIVASAIPTDPLQIEESD